MAYFIHVVEDDYYTSDIDVYEYRHNGEFDVDILSSLFTPTDNDSNDNIDEFDCIDLESNNISIGDITCGICLNIFVRPITLKCNHSFCTSCYNTTGSLKCPICNYANWTESIINYNSPNKIKQLLEKVNIDCNYCNKIHNLVSECRQELYKCKFCNQIIDNNDKAKYEHLYNSKYKKCRILKKCRFCDKDIFISEEIYHYCENKKVKCQDCNIVYACSSIDLAQKHAIECKIKKKRHSNPKQETVIDYDMCSYCKLKIPSHVNMSTHEKKCKKKNVYVHQYQRR